jgi:nitroimidazol reductase NimA-like FMN-containing flavoprotein (pyridoxamine 5'-phosphate oxidase superfamily)
MSEIETRFLVIAPRHASPASKHDMTTTRAPTIRALDDEQSRALLARHHVGRIAFAFHDQVDIEPVLYVADGAWIFGRTSIGTKLSSLAHHPWCAFEIDEVHGLFDWSSVVVKGSFHILDSESGSPDTYERALKLLRELIPQTFLPGDPAPHRTILFGIYSQEISGRSASPGTP